jgi:hypothetical protein
MENNYVEESSSGGVNLLSSSIPIPCLSFLSHPPAAPAGRLLLLVCFRGLT